MGIPEKLYEIKEEDIPALVDMAFSESNPLYPVPRILSREDFRRIYYSLI
jgi:alcohol dehydrogenase class IV